MEVRKNVINLWYSHNPNSRGFVLTLKKDRDFSDNELLRAIQEYYESMGFVSIKTELLKIMGRQTSIRVSRKSSEEDREVETFFLDWSFVPNVIV